MLLTHTRKTTITACHTMKSNKQRCKPICKLSMLRKQIIRGYEGKRRHRHRHLTLVSLSANCKAPDQPHTFSYSSAGVRLRKTCFGRRPASRADLEPSRNDMSRDLVTFESKVKKLIVCKWLRRQCNKHPRLGLAPTVIERTCSVACFLGLSSTVREAVAFLPRGPEVAAS